MAKRRKRPEAQRSEKFLDREEVPRPVTVRAEPLTPLEKLELAMLGPKPQTREEQPLEKLKRALGI